MCHTAVADSTMAWQVKNGTVMFEAARLCRDGAGVETLGRTARLPHLIFLNRPHGLQLGGREAVGSGCVGLSLV